MASDAEARIRSKAEALLRELYPQARIVHEFAVGGVRLDLAAITEDRLILVEIKSELDTLDRLANQLRFACRIGGEVWVVYARRWIDEMAKRVSEQDFGRPVQRGQATYYEANPLYIPDLRKCVELTEAEDGDDLVLPRRYGPHPRERAANPKRYIGGDRYDSRQLLCLLLKPELLAMTQPFGGRSKHTVFDLYELAHEHLTGREIRQAVFSALRSRDFGWACDRPVLAA
jgi:hypothetical protein